MYNRIHALSAQLDNDYKVIKMQFLFLQAVCKQNHVKQPGARVDFARELILFLTCPNGKGSFLVNSNCRKTVINPANQKYFWVVKMTFGPE